MNISLVAADEKGRIFDDPGMSMVMDRGGKWTLPQPGDLLPLPEESELFLLPGRRAAGWHKGSGKMQVGEHLAVAAFAAPGYTLSAHPAYEADANAPMLPLFAYGAVGYARGRFWLAATKVDNDPRQRFAAIAPQRIARGAAQLLRQYPDNRLVGHIINNCVRRYDCPAARNFALGRYEAPLPTSRSCNAACIGCISQQAEDSPIAATPQCRLAFVPTPEEIAQVMSIHAGREKRQPIFSFGQGCEGDPLMNGGLLCQSVALYRGKGGKGTINCNTNASRPEVVESLARAGLTSMRVSMNSARPEFYAAYYRPKGYTFADVQKSMLAAARNGVFVSVNLLYFPGFSDNDAEIAALADLCARCGVSMIQLRNLNIDPHWYREVMKLDEGSPQLQAVGLNNFMKKLHALCPWLRFGYFNPYLGEKADLNLPVSL